MSPENVEVVRLGWDAWIRGDVDALFEVFHPAVEWDTTNFEGWPEDDVYRGHDGLRRFFEEWLASWDRYEAGVDEYIDGGGARVLVLCWQRGFGSDSHVPVHMDYAQLCTLQDGLIRRMAVYSDRSEALEAVGLRRP
jgi:ketosteroid isomerase-like protein